MLTDIFAYRYKNIPIWDTYTEDVRRLMVQSIGVVKDALPYNDADGKSIESSKTLWKILHDRLARELGLKELSPLYFSYQTSFGGQTSIQTSTNTWVSVCETFVTAPYDGKTPADQFIKERLSLIELGLRAREAQVNDEASTYESRLASARMRDLMRKSAMTVSGSAAQGVESRHSWVITTFGAQANELNERLRRVGAPLAYHNGFIQVTNDQLVEREIAKPFWELVADIKWSNVSIDMAEALDQRDNGGKDPAFYAGKALESAIKIISNSKGWTSGSEKGASNYVDNLVSKNNGRFVEVWEAELLKAYFGKVRNTMGHGPGSEPMPQLGREQTDWAIEAAMSWTRSLIKRL